LLYPPSSFVLPLDILLVRFRAACGADSPLKGGSWPWSATRPSGLPMKLLAWLVVTAQHDPGTRARLPCCELLWRLLVPDHVASSEGYRSRSLDGIKLEIRWIGSPAAFGLDMSICCTCGDCLACFSMPRRRKMLVWSPGSLLASNANKMGTSLLPLDTPRRMPGCALRCGF